MSVNSNSRQAYKAIKDLGPKQQTVFYQVKAMEAKGHLPHNTEIAESLGWPINEVTGRVNELKRYGYLRVHGKTKSKFNRSVDVYCTHNPLAEIQMFKLTREDEELEQQEFGHFFGVANG